MQGSHKALSITDPFAGGVKYAVFRFSLPPLSAVGYAKAAET